MRTAFFMALSTRRTASIVKLNSPEIDKRLKNGPELISANFVIPYPPGFPIMVPGQVLTAETIDFMRKLDVKEIHGYEAAQGFKLLKRPDALAQAQGDGPSRTEARARRTRENDSMASFFELLAANPVSSCCSSPSALAVWLGRQVIGQATAWAWWRPPSSSAAALSVWASAYGVQA